MRDIDTITSPLDLQVGRRTFLGGLVGVIAAPAVVRAASIMPVRTPVTMRAPPPVVEPPTVSTRWLPIHVNCRCMLDRAGGLTSEMRFVEVTSMDLTGEGNSMPGAVTLEEIERVPGIVSWDRQDFYENVYAADDRLPIIYKSRPAELRVIVDGPPPRGMSPYGD